MNPTNVEGSGEGRTTGAGEVGVSGDGWGGEEPWIETRAGGLFFINALLVAPELVVLFPLSLQLLVGLITSERNPSPFLDTIPFVASKAIPYLGWLILIPVWTTVRNLRIETRVLPRLALAVFLLSHVSFLGYTVWSWVG
jgi:hypothetical protein